MLTVLPTLALVTASSYTYGKELVFASKAAAVASFCREMTLPGLQREYR